MNRQRTGLLALAALALSPFVPVLLAATGAAVFGCELRYMDAVPCLAGDWNIGPLLTNLFFCLWFLLLTVPLAGILFAVWAVVWTVKARRKT
ncbi:hypothetical protein HLB42_06450 [Deinococcus sp. D7000]|nr:hypothetical protein HLB42_06450 [Deinococcus sp. D7000]